MRTADCALWIVLAACGIVAIGAPGCDDSSGPDAAAGSRGFEEIMRDLDSSDAQTRLAAAKELGGIMPRRLELHIRRIRAVMQKEKDKDVKAALEQVIKNVSGGPRRR